MLFLLKICSALFQNILVLTWWWTSTLLYVGSTIRTVYVLLVVLWYEVCRSQKYVFLVNKLEHSTHTTTTIQHLLRAPGFCKFGNFNDQVEFQLQKNMISSRCKLSDFFEILHSIFISAFSILFSIRDFSKYEKHKNCDTLLTAKFCHHNSTSYNAFEAKTVHDCILRCIDS